MPGPFADPIAEIRHRIREAKRNPERALRLAHLGSQALPEDVWRSIGQLTGLELLDLSFTRIGPIPEAGWEALGSLTKLRVLFLTSCGIGDVPAAGWDALASLPRLGLIKLDQNGITSFPLIGWDIRGKFPVLLSLRLDGNPLPDDLLAAARTGLNFVEYIAAAQASAVHPRTVKLMLLGEPASGKTTLVEALAGNTNPCDLKRLETIGVNVRRIPKICPTDSQPMYLSTWDFAGQPIEHATHQFFLRSGGVFLILWKARLGSDYGQRDLWYWLELLKMRVKDPDFLLVITHTATTPANIDTREIENSYPGFKGSFEIDLCNGAGFPALESKILSLAAASPNMRSAWPAPWLAIREAVRKRRENHPYIPSEEFWKLCSENEITDPSTQRDVAAQLDYLGEIVYFSDPALSRFVVLDPTWLTESVSGIIRDPPIRGRQGLLTKSDLDRVWGQLPGAVRDHLESLMDEFDLVYKAQGHRDQVSIVVESLPHAPASLWNLDIASGRPQTEMVYRFPTLAHHLPPGVPTWAFARAHRHLKPETTPYRNAAQFSDPDTNSEALVLSSEVAREVRLRVAGDYPPYFFGVLDSILRDTFRRYPGAQPELLIPCPCRPECKQSHAWATVLKRKRDGKSDITCPSSGEDVPLSRLLEGFSAGDSKAGSLAAIADLRRIFLNAMSEDKSCPSLFTLAPSRDFKLLDTYLEHATRTEELELTLYCEWDKEWHPTQDSVYRFQPEQAWFTKIKEHWGKFTKITRSVAPLLPILGATKELSEAAKNLSELAGSLASDAEDPTREFTQNLGPRDEIGLVDLESRYLLKGLIDHLDGQRGPQHPKFGGLHGRHRKEDGRFVWFCPRHWAAYERIT